MKKILMVMAAVVLAAGGFRAAGQEVGLRPGQDGTDAPARRALVTLSHCNVRVEPDYESALDNQFLMGRVVEVLDQDRYWVKVGYDEAGRQLTGWVNELMLTEVDEAGLDGWLRAPRYICTAEMSHVYAEPSAKSSYVTEWTMGDIARQVVDGRGKPVRSGKFLAVALPDGRRGYVPKGTAVDFRRWAERCDPTPENVIATAERFLGSPYLWGGTTIKGVDCSGFMQLAFFMNGVLLPRNASSQARCGVDVWVAGVPVEATGALSGAAGALQVLPDSRIVRPGDLFTFGTAADGEKPERTSHIAISLGGLRILQSSQVVRENTLEPGQPDTYDRAPLRVRRVFPAEPGLDAWRGVPGVTLVKDSPLYFAQ
ncbi:MAG: C40 family peptidase [Bacteroidales bacterium]|nr:C40 family peptidase [Bacteroidales bacterium]